MVKVTKMCSGTVWYNSFCWNVSHCVVLYLYILYMGFCGNGYHPFSKWMILFSGLNCPSSISFVEVSERGIVKVIRGALCTITAPCKNEWKTLEEQFEPTGWLLFSNTSWACFCSQRIDETFVAKFGWDWQNYTNKVAFILYGGSLIVRQNTSEQNMLNMKK